MWLKNTQRNNAHPCTVSRHETIFDTLRRMGPFALHLCSLYPASVRAKRRVTDARSLNRHRRFGHITAHKSQGQDGNGRNAVLPVFFFSPETE